MGRFPQTRGQRGSLKWVQTLVNDCPELVNDRLRKMCGLAPAARISWLSPLRADQFAEYRDQSFLDLLEIHLDQHPLDRFWPNRGPQWDALARADTGHVFLIESKAHVDELLSPGTKASEKSRALIDRSMKEVQSFLGIRPAVDWCDVLYQYANRIAHLYLLRRLNKIPAFLIFLYFVGDKEMDGPSTEEEWKSAIKVVRGVLGLRDHDWLSKHIKDVFVSVDQIGNAGSAGK